jgi:hypothetical protein
MLSNSRLVTSYINHQFQNWNGDRNWPLGRTRPKIEIGPKTQFVQVLVFHFFKN